MLRIVIIYGMSSGIDEASSPMNTVFVYRDNQGILEIQTRSEKMTTRMKSMFLRKFKLILISKICVK